ncbi:MAG TPA: hypothetical protein ENI76_10765 [Ignavibacteria bacterium]|nr:hypothetical protein [Ignavibacteria bacterium]
MLYKLQTVSFGYHKARSRLSGVLKLLPDYVDNDYNVIIKTLKENLKKGEDKRPILGLSNSK